MAVGKSKVIKINRSCKVPGGYSHDTQFFKWIGIVLGTLAGLLMLAFIILDVIGGAKWNRIRWNYDFPFDS